MTKPRIPITDKAFRYIPAAQTDLAKTFARERARLKAEQTRNAEEVKAKVRPLAQWVRP